MEATTNNNRYLSNVGGHWIGPNFPLCPSLAWWGSRRHRSSAAYWGSRCHRSSAAYAESRWHHLSAGCAGSRWHHLSAAYSGSRWHHLSAKWKSKILCTPPVWAAYIRHASVPAIELPSSGKTYRKILVTDLISCQFHPSRKQSEASWKADRQHFKFHFRLFTRFSFAFNFLH